MLVGPFELVNLLWQCQGYRLCRQQQRPMSLPQTCRTDPGGYPRRPHRALSPLDAERGPGGVCGVTMTPSTIRSDVRSTVVPGVIGSGEQRCRRVGIGTASRPRSGQRSGLRGDRTSIHLTTSQPPEARMLIHAGRPRRRDQQDAARTGCPLGCVFSGGLTGQLGTPWVGTLMRGSGLKATLCCRRDASFLRRRSGLELPSWRGIVGGLCHQWWGRDDVTRNVDDVAWCSCPKVRILTSLIL